MKKTMLWALALILTATVSCDKKDDISLPDIRLEFAGAEIGLDEDTQQGEIVLQLSRAAAEDVTVAVRMETEGPEYGSGFTTIPAAGSDGSISVTIPAGTLTGLITVSIAEGYYFDGDRIGFTLMGIDREQGWEIGPKNRCELVLGTIVSQGDVMRLQGHTGAGHYGNVVYVDLSFNQQTPVDRTSWDLAFYCGEEFRVFLNGSYLTAAAASDKTDLASVTLEDAEQAIDLNRNPLYPGLPAEAVDSMDGSLEGTVFGEVLADTDRNRVYFVCTERTRFSERGGWYKVKVNRDGDGYAVSYGTVAGGELATVRIEKDAAYNFVNLSLETGEVFTAEPKKEKWDIVWGYQMGWVDNRPYYMQDMVLTNYLNGVETAEVSVHDVPFEDFSGGNLAGLAFSSDRHHIGVNWRNTPTGIYYDRYFVVKDAAGNFYKLRFLTMGLNNDGGERGLPEIEYAFVK